MNRRSHLILVALILAGIIGVAAMAIPASPAHDKPTLGLDLQGGLEVTLQAVPPANRPLQKIDLDRSVTILRDRVENAVIVEQADDGFVGVGSVVEVEDESGGLFEVEISSVAGGVSSDSPLGSALIGAKIGDSVAVQAPKGPWTAKVISVRMG